MMVLKEARRFDKHQAAVHEAGQLTVALASGIRGSARICKTEPANLGEEPAWAGQYSESSEAFLALVAVAGLVAEQWCKDPGVDPNDIVDWIECESLMPAPSADEYFAVPPDCPGAIADALKLLIGHRSFFDWSVRMLMADNAISAGSAWARFHEGDL